MYDEQFIYIAVSLLDDKKNIKTKKASYDDWHGGFEKNADYFIVEIDSENKKETSYGFAVNISGVKSDYMIYGNDSSSRT